MYINVYEIITSDLRKTDFACGLACKNYLILHKVTCFGNSGQAKHHRWILIFFGARNFNEVRCEQVRSQLHKASPNPSEVYIEVLRATNS